MREAERQALILLVDDDPEFRLNILPEALSRLDARTLAASDVLSACLIVAEHHAFSSDPLDLIVLDMNIPLHSGTSSTAIAGGINFLRSYELIRCPVVVFTAYPSFQNCVRSVQAGAQAYLPKMSQDSSEGREGGVDHLVETCRRLLTPVEWTEEDRPTDGGFFAREYEWLRQRFVGRWVALVPEAEARVAGLTGAEHEGFVVIDTESRDDLARRLTEKLAFLGKIPHLAFVLQKGE